MSEPEPCRLGYEEYDGARYCFAHGGFVPAGTRRLICDRKPSPLPLPLPPHPTGTGS